MGALYTPGPAVLTRAMNGAGPPPAVFHRLGSCPPAALSSIGVEDNEASSRVHLRSPARPSPRPPPPDDTRAAQASSPELRTRTGSTRARTPGRRQALSTSLELRRRSAWTSPP